MISRIESLFFSATGNSRQVVNTLLSSLSKALGCRVTASYDVTPMAARQREYCFESSTFVVVGCPVYAGRVPNKIMPFFQHNVKGNSTPVVVVLTYGNRAYDDALREMVGLLSAAGFVVVGAVTQPSQHAFSSRVAQGRPDADDLERVAQYGKTLAERIGTGTVHPSFVASQEELVYYTPLTTQGTRANILKVKPETDRTLCDGCGVCAERCPMGSIDTREPWTVSGICIKCHACVAGCPRHAKTFTDPEFLSHVAMIEANFGTRKDAEFF